MQYDLLRTARRIRAYRAPAVRRSGSFSPPYVASYPASTPAGMMPARTAQAHAISWRPTMSTLLELSTLHSPAFARRLTGSSWASQPQKWWVLLNTNRSISLQTTCFIVCLNKQGDNIPWSAALSEHSSSCRPCASTRKSNSGAAPRWASMHSKCPARQPARQQPGSF